MIRVLRVKCNNNFRYCKKMFINEEIYKAYIGKTGFIVLNEGERVYFNDRRPGMLRFETFSKSFKNNFEIVEEDLVKNKLDLNNYIYVIE